MRPMTRRAFHSSASISDDGRYRWWLRRVLSVPLMGHSMMGEVCFIMLNPSTADDTTDDPTVRRCMAFARYWGFRSLCVRNLFPLRSTNPRTILRDRDPYGGADGSAAIVAARESDLVVAAWGAFVPFKRDEEAISLLGDTHLCVLGLCKNGRPRHPLYVRSDAKPCLWTPRPLV